ncbi:hypothetical protein TRVL_07100 [Trypanosoma vivax]|nr:hypothetical protein TRVL_07100 [Trypanosoma vivax]
MAALLGAACAAANAFYAASNFSAAMLARVVRARCPFCLVLPKRKAYFLQVPLCCQVPRSLPSLLLRLCGGVVCRYFSERSRLLLFRCFLLRLRRRRDDHSDPHCAAQHAHLINVSFLCRIAGKAAATRENRPLVVVKTINCFISSLIPTDHRATALPPSSRHARLAVSPTLVRLIPYAKIPALLLGTSRLAVRACLRQSSPSSGARDPLRGLYFLCPRCGATRRGRAVLRLEGARRTATGQCRGSDCWRAYLPAAYRPCARLLLCSASRFVVALSRLSQTWTCRTECCLGANAVCALGRRVSKAPAPHRPAARPLTVSEVSLVGPGSDDAVQRRAASSASCCGFPALSSAEEPCTATCRGALPATTGVLRPPFACSQRAKRPHSTGPADVRRARDAPAVHRLRLSPTCENASAEPSAHRASPWGQTAKQYHCTAVTARTATRHQQVAGHAARGPRGESMKGSTTRNADEWCEKQTARCASATPPGQTEPFSVGRRRRGGEG